MNKKYSKFLVILIIALSLEVIVFNITSYCNLFGKYEKKEYEFSEENYGAQNGYDNVEVNNISNLQYYGENDEKVFIKVPKINTKTVSVKLELNNIDRVVDYQVYFADETSTEYQYLISKKYVQDYEKSKYMPLYLSGETESLLISIDKDLYENSNLNKVTINEKIPFEFNFIRFTIVLGIIIFSYFLKTGELFNKEYSNKNLKQEIVLIGIIAEKLEIKQR